MVSIIMLSGRNAPQSRKAPAPPQAPAVIEANQARIQEYRARIDEQARKLSAEQTELLREKKALGVAGESQGAGRPPATSQIPAPVFYPAPAREPENDSIEADQKKREYKALFASNLALSYRKTPEMPSPASAATPLSQADLNRLSSGRHGTTNVDSERAQGHKPPDPDQRHESPQAPGDKHDGLVLTPESGPSPNQAGGKRYRLFEGTVFETVLTNRLDGTFSGPVNCMVTTDVYSHDRQHLLIAQGARILGEVRKLESFGEKRLAVFFHRLIMPDGYSVSLDKFQGLNQIGETGLTDLVNHHYLQIFGVSLAIGAIAGLSQANTRYGIDTVPADAYRQGVASSLTQSSMHILDRYLNVLPTITIREGHRVKVYLSNDLLLPAYDRHELPDDL